MSAAQQQLHALGAAQQAQDVRVTTREPAGGAGVPLRPRLLACQVGRGLDAPHEHVRLPRQDLGGARRGVFPLTCSRRTTSRGRKDDPRANRSRSPAIF